MTEQQPKYKNIPTEDWVRYPEIKPKESGYYFTVYQDYPDGKDVGNLFYKCIYWCNKREDWISWKSPFRETPHIFKVGCFIEKTRTDFYCSCIEKVEELYLKKMTDQQPTLEDFKDINFEQIIWDELVDELVAEFKKHEDKYLMRILYPPKND